MDFFKICNVLGIKTRLAELSLFFRPFILTNMYPVVVFGGAALESINLNENQIVYTFINSKIERFSTKKMKKMGNKF